MKRIPPILKPEDNQSLDSLHESVQPILKSAFFSFLTVLSHLSNRIGHQL